MALEDIRNVVVFSFAVLAVLAFLMFGFTGYSESRTDAAGTASESTTATAEETTEKEAVMFFWTA